MMLLEVVKYRDKIKMIEIEIRREFYLFLDDILIKRNYKCRYE